MFVDKQVQNVRFPLIPFICSFSFPVLLLTVSLRSYTLQVIESRCPLQQVPRLFRRFNHRKCYQKVKHSNNMIIITTDSSLVTKHITTIGTLRSNDADGEENVKKKKQKKNNRFYEQNNSFARASHFFCTFLSRFCTTTT